MYIRVLNIRVMMIMYESGDVTHVTHATVSCPCQSRRPSDSLPAAQLPQHLAGQLVTAAVTEVIRNFAGRQLWCAAACLTVRARPTRGPRAD